MNSKRQTLFSYMVVIALVVGHLAGPLPVWAAPAAEPEATPGLIPAASSPIEPQTVAFQSEAQLSARQTVTPSAAITLKPVGHYEIDDGTAEIVTYDPVGKTLYAANSDTNTVELISISDPAGPVSAGSIDLAPYGSGVTSVDFYSYEDGTGLLAAVVEADPAQAPGTLAVFDQANTLVFTETTGALPDMVTFTPDGQKILVANEGEPGDDYSVDPEGSVTIVSLDLSFEFDIFLPIIFKSSALGAAALAYQETTLAKPAAVVVDSVTVATADFQAFNAQEAALKAAGVRIFGPGATVAQDLEPEYIAVSDDSATAYVTLQENNALAVVDIGTATVTDILPLGFKDHSQAGNDLDPSDEDDTNDLDDQENVGAQDVEGEIKIQTWPVFGMYQPDAIAAYEAGGQVYLVTANEGDAREYETEDETVSFAEEARVGDLTLDTTAFPDATIQDDARLGRLTVTTATVGSTSGDTDGDGEYEELYAFGARSFSIWNASNGSLVYDSGSDFEQITAAADPANFNDDGENEDGGDDGDYESRSDNKGPEPEGVVVGEVAGRTYAFIGLERVGGVMVYDVTNPAAAEFTQYVNTRYVYGDQAPEGLKFIAAADSPTTRPLLAVSFEESDSVTIFEISSPDGAGRLTLLHNNDGESQIFPVTNRVDDPTSVTLQVAGISAYKAVLDREIAAARENGHAVVNVYAGDAFLASAALQCSYPITDTNKPVYDAIAQRQMNYDAHALGNHEFDNTPDFLERFIRDYRINGALQQPFLSANLDFSGEPDYADLIDPDGVYESYTIEGEVVARSAIVIDEGSGQRFGIVAAITPGLPTVSSPRDVEVTTETIAQAVIAIQTEVDRLQTRGVNKIILVSHLQNLDVDTMDVVPNLDDVDIAVGGGGDELLANQDILTTTPLTDQLLPGEDPDDVAGNYPLVVRDNSGRDVYVVTTAGNYKYAGRLDVEFDAAGEVTQVIQENSYPRRVIPDTTENQAAITALGLTDAVAPDPFIEDSVVAPVQQCLEDFDNEVVATSNVLLDVSRNGVRGEESNAGNLITDSYLYIHDKYASENGIAPPGSRTIAVQNGGGIRQNAGDELPVSGTVPGPITVLNTFDVLAFTTNKVTIVRNVSSTEVKQIFERAASSLPGAGGQFLQAAGLAVTYSITRTAQEIGSDGTVTTPGQRVRDIILEDGTPIVDDGVVVSGAPAITITTNSFTAGGGDNYPWLATNTEKIDLRDDQGVLISYDQAWREFMADSGGLGGVIPVNDAYDGIGHERIIILVD